MFRQLLNELSERAQINGKGPVTQWTVCIPQNDGRVQRYQAGSLRQAKLTGLEWLSAGVGAWMEDAEGNKAHAIAKMPMDVN